MKKLLALAILIFVASCKSTGADKEVNKTMPDPDEEYTAIMVGPANREGLEAEPFSSWFNTNISDYKVDNKTVSTFKQLLPDVTIKIFMGTWCEDSQLVVPQFYKIMDTANFDYGNLELTTLTREKDTPQQLEKGLDIINVPTIIFYRNGKELNRIVEYPIESLEKDMLLILSDSEYKHAYAE